MPQDISRFIRDFRAAKSIRKWSDQESVESHYRKIINVRELVRNLPHPGSFPQLDAPQLCDGMREWELLEKVHKENARSNVRSARVDQ